VPSLETSQLQLTALWYKVMGKEQRKKRLEKGHEKAAFIGFSAFSHDAAFASPTSTNSTSLDSSTSTPQTQWSIIYTGSDTRFATVFARISQKRDATTKVRSLQELVNLLKLETLLKPQKIAALQHYTWLYANKLYYDDSPMVRAASVSVWSDWAQQLPKATASMVQRYPHLTGMIYSTQVDADANVRSAGATATCVCDNNNNNNNWPWQQGILLHTQTILSYTRPSAMHEAIFARTMAAVDTLTDAQKVAIDERFERIVGTALAAMELYVRTTSEESFSLQQYASSDFWFKTLNSNKPLLRLKTYQLLCSCLAKHFNALQLEATVAQCLNTEKEPANVPVLLETVLAMLIARKQQPQQQHTDIFTKPLVKQFRHVCFGARADVWGPTVLPLIALSQQPLALLQALAQAGSGSDRWHISKALVETCVYVLLRDNDNNNNQINDARKVADLWLGVLQLVLTTPSTGMLGQTRVAHAQVVLELAKNSAVQLQDVNRTKCAFYAIQDWFWETAFVLDGSNVTTVTEFVRAVRGQHAVLEQPNRLLPKAREFFMKDLASYNASSGAVPTDESYRLYEEVFLFCGPTTIFVDQGSLERFLVNDLLRWICLHTCSLAEHTQSAQLVRYDFGLLGLCLNALDEARNSVWESVLREVIAVKPSLSLLTVGILKLVEDAEGKCDWLLCATLDEYANQRCVSGYTVDSSDDCHEVDDTVELNFMRLALGLTAQQSRPLIDPIVVKAWIESVSCGQFRAVLLDVLLQAVEANRDLFASEDVHIIFSACWLRGNQLFSTVAQQIFHEDPSLYHQFITESSKLLSLQLHDLCALSCERKNSLVEECLTWAQRALRLLGYTKELSPSSDEAPKYCPSFSLIGLSDIKLWTLHADVLYTCTRSLFDGIASHKERLNLIKDSDESTVALLNSILLSTSGGSLDASSAGRVRTYRDRSGWLLFELGGKDMSKNLLEDMIRSLVDSLVGALSSDDGEDATRKSVGVLTQLIGLRFLPLSRPGTGKVVPENVKEGDSLWYVMDTNKPHDCERVTIVRVYYDAQTGHYFSIVRATDGGEQERQTVADRLRSELQTSTCITREDISIDEWTKRDEFRRVIINRIITPFYSSTSSRTTVHELVNVVCCHIGFNGARGIGTERYDVLSLLKAAEEQLSEAFRLKESDAIINLLWKLSLSLGYSLNASRGDWIFDELPLDPTIHFAALLGLYNSPKLSASPDRDVAVLAWLSTALPHIMKKSCDLDWDAKETTGLAFRLGFFLFERYNGALTNCELIVARSLSDVLVSSCCFSGLDIVSSTEAEGCVRLCVRRFASFWDANVAIDAFGSPTGIDWSSFSGFSELIQAAESNDAMQNVIIAACDANNVELLSKTLFIKSKRHLSLRLLDLVARTGDPLFTAVPLNAETTRRLKDWTSSFEDEEAEEVKEDVEIVSRWLPRFMMDEIEKWGEEIYEDTDDSITIGRLLSWLCVLRFVDIVAPKEFRFRPAFVSYLSQCGAADAALNIAILNDEAINDPKGQSKPSLLDVEDLLQDQSLLLLPKLSSLVLFRSVEIVPSLSRRWWEQSCPKVYITDTQMFVEKYVAPEILNRELTRIRASTASFGDMTVTGSVATRQVMATYVQDDFTLSVWIMLPTAFPFRSANVDCSKTFGVPVHRWKRWSLQITLMLNNQGGTLQDALLLWKDNVDQEFKGVEPCPVCYSVLHVKTHKLPTLECKTCNNRFHIDCLTQWFRSSGKSQCVLCQQPWQGSRLH
jgi:hypothetical protein